MAARRGLVIGRLAGIPVRVHPTFLVLIALALVGGLGPPAQGLLWLVLLFASVVAHELAHSLTARRFGVRVKDILLLPIGGVSEFERLPSAPRQELLVAAVGPLTSLALGIAVATVAAVAFGTALLPVDLVHGTVLHRLAWLNVLLAGFNMLPAFPMDGGRVVRAALAERIGLARATQVAARLGRVVAFLMAAAGLAFDIWLLLIAGFVYLGNKAEEASTLVHLRLAGKRVADVMVPVAGAPGASLGDVAFSPDEPLEDALRRLPGWHQIVPVVDPETGALVGMVVVDDLAALLDTAH
ncbi:MAG TPA: site-2 protease family protein [Acidimicrobiales bacterium]|nr:site-2 protease family protein [Acidimicrobiales bacterium]